MAQWRTARFRALQNVGQARIFTAMLNQLLTQLQIPTDLRRLPVEALPQVCEELRQFIVDQVSRHGGHFGASLGTVELTVALHYVFDTPNDVLVWDVGHQAYGHKILTGRRELFSSNRTLGGLSGFPKRAESQYDAFGTGHSSTSISAALGLAQAAALQGHAQRQHVAIIGDGAMTAGLAFEALNNAGSAALRSLQVLIVLNDNGMSIDQNVGALPQHFADLRNQGLAGPHPPNIFQNLQLPYTGVVDGHDIIGLINCLIEQKNRQGVRVLHLRTIKGKGYPAAEEEQVTWHSPGKFDKLTGIIRQKTSIGPQAPKYQDVFGQTLTELAQQNDRIVAVTPAMLSGSSLNQMKATFPTRTFDVGIAEQHAVTFAAGMAAGGLLPYCVIYSTFLQRAYDQIIHDVCVQGLRLVLCVDRAGLVGADGATHHGAFDIAYLRCLPNVIVAAPMDEVELRNLLFTAQQDGGLTAQSNPLAGQAFCIRYPRGQGVRPDWHLPLTAIAIGTGRLVHLGEKIAILTLGHVGNFAHEACQSLAAEHLRPSLYDLRFAKPLDEVLLMKIFTTYYAIITVEDGCITGGFGSAVLEWASVNGFGAKTVVRLGIPDHFIDHGEPEELYAECGFGPADIAQAARHLYFQFGSLAE